MPSVAWPWQLLVLAAGTGSAAGGASRATRTTCVRTFEVRTMMRWMTTGSSSTELPTYDLPTRNSRAPSCSEGMSMQAEGT